MKEFLSECHEYILRIKKYSHYLILLLFIMLFVMILQNGIIINKFDEIESNTQWIGYNTDKLDSKLNDINNTLNLNYGYIK